ncbi:MAG: hypothetical protein M1838_001944 [Thelocarpon superellum]|nr:MAG: hypothetical protein M1838_001944 [Thelocarpon superellum]
MSACDSTLHAPIAPHFPSKNAPSASSSSSSATAGDEAQEPTSIAALIHTLGLLKHPEGGYFVETDRDARRVPNPFQDDSSYVRHGIVPTAAQTRDGDDTTRCASTTIYYLLTPGNPQGVFHLNRGRTVHTLHQGRGRYVIIHADEVDGTRGRNKARIETFVVGHNVTRGEKMQWIVEGGKFKASLLLPDRADETGSENGLLISETVIPGFEFRDHDFMTNDQLIALLDEDQAKELGWLVRKT